MNLQEALLSRRTVYRFEDREVPASVLEAAFEAARWAPCHKHTNPWRFYELGPQILRKNSTFDYLIGGTKGRRVAPRAAGKRVAKAIGKIRDVPVLVAVTSARSAEDAFREKGLCGHHERHSQLGCPYGPKVWGPNGAPNHPSRANLRGFGHRSSPRRAHWGFSRRYPAKVPSPPKKPLNEVWVQLD